MWGAAKCPHSWGACPPGLGSHTGIQVQSCVEQANQGPVGTGCVLGVGKIQVDFLEETDWSMPWKAG